LRQGGRCGRRRAEQLVQMVLGGRVGGVELQGAAEMFFSEFALIQMLIDGAHDGVELDRIIARLFSLEGKRQGGGVLVQVNQGDGHLDEKGAFARRQENGDSIFIDCLLIHADAIV